MINVSCDKKTVAYLLEHKPELRRLPPEWRSSLDWWWCDTYKLWWLRFLLRQGSSTSRFSKTLHGSASETWRHEGRTLIWTFKGKLLHVLNAQYHALWKLLKNICCCETCGKKSLSLLTFECQIFHSEQVGAEGTLCALTLGFCHSFCVKPWRESQGPDWGAQKWLCSFWHSGCPQFEQSKLQKEVRALSHL